MCQKGPQSPPGSYKLEGRRPGVNTGVWDMHFSPLSNAGKVKLWRRAAGQSQGVGFENVWKTAGEGC